jgi:hypothetical protein
MVWVDKTDIGSIIIPLNNREEIRLSLQRRQGVRFVDLSMYVLDQEGEKVPTGNRLSINVKLWPQFRTAASHLEPCIDVLSVRHQEMAQSNGGGRPIFPSSIALKKYLQDQIYLEQKNFRGIPFINFQAPIRSPGRRPQSPQGLITLGPIFRPQLMRALNIMEAFLIHLGFYAEKAMEEESTQVLQDHGIGPHVGRRHRRPLALPSSSPPSPP